MSHRSPPALPLPAGSDLSTWGTRPAFRAAIGLHRGFAGELMR
jgi:hypothetical protein